MNGLLVIDKPVGLTSFDVVARVRRRVREWTGVKRPKVGHTGTLDPFATGVLPICIGQATRLSQYLIEGDKHYRVTMRLGSSTDTDDSTGEVLQERATTHVTEAMINASIEGLVGRFEQIPPRYSAIHVDGKRAYALARQGVEFELAPRSVEVFGVDVRRVALPDVDFDVKTSKGTYVRSICRDLGVNLGTRGHCHALRRLSSATFDITHAMPLDVFLEASREDVEAVLKPLMAMVPHVPLVEVDAAQAQDLRHGKRVDVPCERAVGELVRVGLDGVLVCLALVEAVGRLKPQKVIAV